MTDEDVEVVGTDELKTIVDECEQQTDKSPCECVMERIKMMT